MRDARKMERMFKLIGKTYIALLVSRLIIGLGFAAAWKVAREHADRNNDDLSVVELDYHMSKIEESNRATRAARALAKETSVNFVKGVTGVLRRMV